MLPQTKSRSSSGRMSGHIYLMSGKALDIYENFAKTTKCCTQQWSTTGNIFVLSCPLWNCTDLLITVVSELQFHLLGSCPNCRAEPRCSNSGYPTVGLSHSVQGQSAPQQTSPELSPYELSFPSGNTKSVCSGGRGGRAAGSCSALLQQIPHGKTASGPRLKREDGRAPRSRGAVQTGTQHSLLEGRRGNA